MIKRFSVLYQGGIIDGEDLGYSGTPVDNREYDNDRLLSVYDVALTLAKSCEDWGYDTLWLAEHHLQHEGYEVLHNLPMTSLWLAENTDRIKLGCGFNVVPTWHPLRLAEDFATVDHLTNGRVRFGVGRGYHERELVTYNSAMVGMPDNERREYFEEEVQVLKKSFELEKWSHEGKFFNLPPKNSMHRGTEIKNITLVPRPPRQVEIWQPTTSGNPQGLRFMAEHDIRGMIAGMPLSFIYDLAEKYRDAFAERDRHLELGEGLIVGFRAFVADTQEAAREAARIQFEEYAKFGAPLGVFPYTPETLKIQKNLGRCVPESPRMTTFEETLASGAWFAGTPEQLVSLLHEIQDRLPGLEEVLFNLHIPAAHAENLTLLEKISKEVMPHFSGVK